MRLTTTGGFLSDLRVGKALMTSERMVTFRGPCGNGQIVIFDGEPYCIRAKTAARIKKERTRRNLPWNVELA